MDSVQQSRKRRGKLLGEGRSLERQRNETGSAGELLLFLEFVEGLAYPFFLAAANLLEFLVARTHFICELPLLHRLRHHSDRSLDSVESRHILGKILLSQTSQLGLKDVFPSLGR